ncbi:MAG: hypothetical protein MK105_19540, partial [Crocinitomicaceae bacterium]|nr:hypothetical protein [Crocinitomicaceae bacterium]
TELKNFKTISEYSKGINIDTPKHPHFDILSFEENMTTVHREMPSFRHEFYAIAIKAEGDGKAQTGGFTDFPDDTVVFFNTPFQILSWDIVPNWKGFYLMFGEDFMAQSIVFIDLLRWFPFLKMEESVPFSISGYDLKKILNIYQNIWDEYNGSAEDKFNINLSSILKYCYLLRSNGLIFNSGFLRKETISNKSRNGICDKIVE